MALALTSSHLIREYLIIGAIILINKKNHQVELMV